MLMMIICPGRSCRARAASLVLAAAPCIRLVATLAPVPAPVRSVRHHGSYRHISQNAAPPARPPRPAHRRHHDATRASRGRASIRHPAGHALPRPGFAACPCTHGRAMCPPRTATTCACSCTAREGVGRGLRVRRSAARIGVLERRWTIILMTVGVGARQPAVRQSYAIRAGHQHRSRPGRLRPPPLTSDCAFRRGRTQARVRLRAHAHLHSTPCRASILSNFRRGVGRVARRANLRVCAPSLGSMRCSLWCRRGASSRRRVGAANATRVPADSTLAHAPAPSSVSVREIRDSRSLTCANPPRRAVACATPPPLAARSASTPRSCIHILCTRLLSQRAHLSPRRARAARASLARTQRDKGSRCADVSCHRHTVAPLAPALAPPRRCRALPRRVCERGTAFWTLPEGARTVARRALRALVSDAPTHRPPGDYAHMRTPRCARRFSPTSASRSPPAISPRSLAWGVGPTSAAAGSSRGAPRRRVLTRRAPAARAVERARRGACGYCPRGRGSAEMSAARAPCRVAVDPRRRPPQRRRTSLAAVPRHNGRRCPMRKLHHTGGRTCPSAGGAPRGCGARVRACGWDWGRRGVACPPRNRSSRPDLGRRKQLGAGRAWEPCARRPSGAGLRALLDIRGGAAAGAHGHPREGYSGRAGAHATEVYDSVEIHARRL
ncbi:hypothetical protein WOLCODRAFT_139486 [Wolfiporia cocos MD-104 SS10]|uniref:Uncharacterized protein n=1 Tax=Wolfiporia cocos (strain MD-104) TaxID=742152 RepID=A0A2H3IXG2_WOLCO|nr:hypothetical protein WOLCODRAFT_139486 [Wolfiporia cocos MD-104 SS10]